MSWVTAVVVATETLVVAADAYLSKVRKAYEPLHRVAWWRYGPSFLAATALMFLGLTAFDQGTLSVAMIVTGVLIPVVFADALSRILALRTNDGLLGNLVCTAGLAGAVLVVAWQPL